MNQKFSFDKVAKFIRRLYKLANDESVRELTWTPDGTRIQIRNKDQFMKNTLHLISKTREYSTFVRQLNIYGFVKVKSLNSDSEEYYNQNFVRDREDLLRFITRDKEKPPSTPFDKIAPPNNKFNVESAVEYLNSHNFRYSNEVEALKERLDKQEQTINGLIEVLSRVFRVNTEGADRLRLQDNLKRANDIDDFLSGKYGNSMGQISQSTRDMDDYFASLPPIEQLSRNNTESDEERNSTKDDSYYNEFF